MKLPTGAGEIFILSPFCCEASPIPARRAEIRSTLRNAGFVFLRNKSHGIFNLRDVPPSLRALDLPSRNNLRRLRGLGYLSPPPCGGERTRTAKQCGKGANPYCPFLKATHRAENIENRTVGAISTRAAPRYKVTHRCGRDFCTPSFCCEASILARRAAASAGELPPLAQQLASPARVGVFKPSALRRRADPHRKAVRKRGEPLLLVFRSHPTTDGDVLCRAANRLHAGALPRPARQQSRLAGLDFMRSSVSKTPEAAFGYPLSGFCIVIRRPPRRTKPTPKTGFPECRNPTNRIPFTFTFY